MMAKCDDGRKHVVVKGYRNKKGKTIARYERSCPTRNTVPDKEKNTCCVCGEETPRNDMRTFMVKGQEKSICPGCADTIHGLM